MADVNLINMEINELSEKLGIIGAIRFLEQYDDGGSGDCVKEKYEKEDINAEEYFKQLEEAL